MRCEEGCNRSSPAVQLRNVCTTPRASEIQITVLESILYVCFSTVTTLLLVPYELINGTPVPTVLFKGLPSTFHAFIISIVLAFSGAFSALLIPNKPIVARFSMASMASALLIVMWAMSQACAS
ncbi:hypothetical protein FEM48_Zijuj10G0107100 [Ziziphus jujuba var. spinosa]|uniref:Uncharacterized protein n=1 Tax=Ziziphus jujuba var. spinosa TaxID=714518 RepID=A0A978UMW8_ZIZJJ|nr:hypothetical protein FEM48_Zijuj10G0107100 [Ziziphus jujuba var. spinosa]